MQCGVVAAAREEPVVPAGFDDAPMIEYDDLVGMLLFLLSDEAGWITGQIFNVDGGQIIRS